MEAAGAAGLSVAGRRAARTARQAEVLRRLVAGADMAAIAGELGIGASRVREIAMAMAVRLGTTSVETMIALAKGGAEVESRGVSRPA
jgi:FixJ family two-component response regulator